MLHTSGADRADLPALYVILGLSLGQDDKRSGYIAGWDRELAAYYGMVVKSDLHHYLPLSWELHSRV